MEGKHHEHQSLALLAGVAVDKGPETDGSIPMSRVIHHVDEAGVEQLEAVNAARTMVEIVQRGHILHFPINRSHHHHNHNQEQTSTLPIEIQMGDCHGIVEGGHTEMVEVQYIIGASGDFHVAQEEDDIHDSKIVIEQIEGVEETVVEMNDSQHHVITADHSQGHLETVSVEDHVAQEEVITGIVVDDEIMSLHINEMITEDVDSSIQKIEYKHEVSISEQDNSMSSDGRNEDREEELSRKCFLCQTRGKSFNYKDLFSEESKKIMLPQLLNRYMSISIVPKYNSKNDFPVCEECISMILRCHDVSLKYQEKRNNESAASSAVDFSEDENSQDDQQSNSNNNAKKGGRGKYQKRIGTRKYRYALLQSQIKNQMFNSPFHYLIKREFSEDDWEFIAERLHSTKSNSSAKIKEIENLTFGNEKLVSIFCDDCRKSISGGKEGYYDHRRMFHSGADDYTLPCDICGNFYPEKDSTGLSRNYFPHWINHFYFEECPECKEKCPNASLLKKHMAIHQQRPGFPCPKCDKVLAKKITLEQHIKTHLPDEEKKKHALTCHICGKIITAPTLKAHMFSVHSDERPWKCEVCGAKFKHKSDLSGHRNAVHLKIKNFNCNVCGKSFGHHCGLRVHMMKHENKREHACPTCGKKFITQWHLKKHVVTHKEEKDVICLTCGKGFKKLEALQEHMTIHTGEMPHECHICGRRVRVLSNLYKHYMVHKKNKTYYSKKDGLPDPLDAYIVEQQKKKQVNKIVQQNTVLKPISSDDMKSGTTGTVVVKSEDLKKSFETSTPIPTSVPGSGSDEPELKVNRSTNRITYRGPASSTPPSENPQHNLILIL